MRTTFQGTNRDREEIAAAAEVVPTASEFARIKLGFEADERQREVLDSKTRRGILNCTRQWGKSTVAAAKAVHRAWTEPGCLVLIASPSERQSAELLMKIEEFVRRLGVKPRGDGTNSLSIRLPNGSRIVGLPGMEGTVRGFSAVSLMLIDEASRVPDALYKALRPMLAVKNGDLWLMSTPFGQRGFFWREWAHGGDRWHRVSVAGPDCARIPAEFLKEEKGTIGSHWFAQEYLCVFTGTGSGWFSGEMVQRSLSDDAGLEL